MRHAVLLLILAVVSACGGGGGGGGASAPTPVQRDYLVAVSRPAGTYGTLNYESDTIGVRLRVDVWEVGSSVQPTILASPPVTLRVYVEGSLAYTETAIVAMATPIDVLLSLEDIGASTLWGSDIDVTATVLPEDGYPDPNAANNSAIWSGVLRPMGGGSFTANSATAAESHAVVITGDTANITITGECRGVTITESFPTSWVNGEFFGGIHTHFDTLGPGGSLRTCTWNIVGQIGPDHRVITYIINFTENYMGVGAPPGEDFTATWIAVPSVGG
jgi:hypothetical protein